MVEASCHCGAVRLRMPSPQEVTECNCSICRRYGVIWAYCSPREVTFMSPVGETDAYLWDDRSIAFHRCRGCGCVTHWAAEDATRDRMGINARLLASEVLAAARLRHLDGAVTEEYLDEAPAGCAPIRPRPA